MFVTGFMGMWMSNSATAMVMMPMAVSIAALIGQKSAATPSSRAPTTRHAHPAAVPSSVVSTRGSSRQNAAAPNGGSVLKPFDRIDPIVSVSQHRRG